MKYIYGTLLQTTVLRFTNDIDIAETYICMNMYVSNRGNMYKLHVVLKQSFINPTMYKYKEAFFDARIYIYISLTKFTG